MRPFRFFFGDRCRLPLPSTAFRPFTIRGMGFERELNELERAIERVNAEYGAFLYGASARAPVESRRLVDQLLRRLNSVEIDEASDRYRLATLQGHYNSLAERWERQQAEKEAGRRPGLYASFKGPALRPTGAAGRSSAAVARSAPNADSPTSVPSEGPPADRALFDRYVAAKKAHGEDVEGYDFRQFAENLGRERQKVREKMGNDDFEFDVKDTDGRVRVVARRKPGGSR
jgi:hypothetical protein